MPAVPASEKLLDPRCAACADSRLADERMRPTPLRRRLLLLAAVAILPLALMSGVALQALLDQQRRQTEQSSLDLARALATAVDTELRLTVSALQSPALTEPLGSARARSTSPSAHESARRASRGPPGMACDPCWPRPAGVDPLQHRCYRSVAPMPPRIAEPDEPGPRSVRTGAARGRTALASASARLTTASRSASRSCATARCAMC